MSTRAVAFTLAIMSILFAVPRAAEAGKAKSPYWAWVDAEGNLLDGNGATQAFRFNTGDYYVDFDDFDLTHCAFSGTTSSGFAGVVGVYNEQPGTPTGSRVRVFVVNDVGVKVNVPFYLIATCRK